VEWSWRHIRGVGSFLAECTIRRKAKKIYQAYSITICNSLETCPNHRYAYQIESNRYFELKLRPPRATKRKPVITKQKVGRAEDELKANLNSLTLASADDDDTPMPDTRDSEEDETSFKIEDIPLTLDLPQRRFNAALAVGMDDKLYIYGGTYEIPGRGEMTLDDFHVIDLGKLDGVRTLYNKTILPLDELVSSSSDDDSASNDDDDNDDHNASQKDEKMEDLPPQLQTPLPQTKMDLDIPSQKIDTIPATTTMADDESSESSTTSFNPAFPQPLPFETLKAYYDRTAKEWLSFISERSKAARREAFVKAEGYWWECREEVREIEERMEESGVKEVVVATADRKEKRR